jgi:hypothetical protein
MYKEAVYMYKEAVEKKAVEEGQADQVEVYVSVRERDVSAYVEKRQAHLVERSYTSSLRSHTLVAHTLVA